MASQSADSLVPGRIPVVPQPPVYSRLCDTDARLAGAYYAAYGSYMRAVGGGASGVNGAGFFGAKVQVGVRPGAEVQGRPGVVSGGVRGEGASLGHAGPTRRGKRGGRKHAKAGVTGGDVAVAEEPEEDWTSEEVGSCSEREDSYVVLKKESPVREKEKVRCAKSYLEMGVADRVMLRLRWPIVEYLDASIDRDVDRRSDALGLVDEGVASVRVPCEPRAMAVALLDMVQGYAEGKGAEVMRLCVAAELVWQCFAEKLGAGAKGVYRELLVSRVVSGQVKKEVEAEVSMRGGALESDDDDEECEGAFEDVEYAADVGLWCCGVCGFENESRAQAVVHLRGHGVAYPHEVWGEGEVGECNVCGKRVAMKWRVRHLKTHDGPTKCDDCGRDCGSPAALRKHEKSHEKPVRCADCDYSCSCQRDLGRHRTAVHGEKSQTFVCGCGAKFGRYDHLKRHRARGRRSDACLL